jgi:hypothetical protein
MKKILLSTLVFIVFFISCEKEQTNNELADFDLVSQIENEGKFKEEIVVFDESGRNQAFYAIYSDDKILLAEYLKKHEFTLKINELNVEETQVSNFNNYNDYLKSGKNDFDLTQEPKIIVELVTTNLQDNVKSYSLEINGINLKSANDFIFGYPVGYTTSNDFIGAVHRGYGYEFVVRFSYKTGWLSSWKDFVVNGGNAWFVYPSNEYYISLGESYDFYKRRIIIYPHYYQSSTNYHIAYVRNDYRSRTCEIGTYDYNVYGECYVGTAPVGTTAFIWGPNENQLSFYYTPVNGNQCPMAGSSFDGANCYVMAIPAGCEPYIWGRSWLVKSNIINN